MSSVGEVVVQLLAVVERLDRAVVSMTRSEAEAQHAHGSFAEVGRGSDHRSIRTSVAASSEAVAKSGKVARLLAEAAGHFAAYANEIAPGAAPSRDKATETTPQGAQLVSEAPRGKDGFRRFAKMVADKADSAGETGKKVVDFLAEAAPSGTTSTTQLPPTPRNPTIAGTPGDAAQALVVTAAAVIAVALKAASLRKQRKEQKRDRPDRLP